MLGMVVHSGPDVILLLLWYIIYVRDVQHKKPHVQTITRSEEPREVRLGGAWMCGDIARYGEIFVW